MTKKSDTHWYSRYVGDYGKKTQDLSLAEHGAYTLLLDYYYSCGRPNANASVLHRICRAFGDAEQQAVHTVAKRFFREEEGFLVNDRAEEELIKRTEISEKRSKSAKDRWKTKDAKPKQKRSKKNANAYPNADTTTTTTTIDNNDGKIKPDYEFVSGIIRLTKKDWDKWVTKFAIPEDELEKLLVDRGIWYDKNPDKKGVDWYVRTERYLAGLVKR